MSNFGIRLKKLRKENNLSQSILAEKLNFSRSTITNYEQNKRHPNPDTLIQLADFFDVSLDYLLGRSDVKTGRFKRPQEELLNFHKTLGKTLGTIIHLSIPHKIDHNKKTAQLTTAIANKLNLDRGKINILRTAALLHDIGEIFLPPEILNKPGTLTKYEYQLIKTHTRRGFNFLQQINLDQFTAKIALQHHERNDGSGYPRGLTGSEIIREVQIVMIADVIAALTSNRPYREARSIDYTLEYLTAKKGQKFSEKLTEICLQLFTEENFSFSTPVKIDLPV